MLYQGSDLVALDRWRLGPYKSGAFLVLGLEGGLLHIFGWQPKYDSQRQAIVQAARRILVHVCDVVDRVSRVSRVSRCMAFRREYIPMELPIDIGYWSTLTETIGAGAGFGG